MLLWGAIAAVILLALYAGGWHIKHQPTADELFGCKNTYINQNGEDTGECG